MPRFNLENYQDVQSRLNALHKENPDARIVTENLTTPSDRSVLTWVVKASLYLTAGDQANGLAKATGHAFEIDGGSGANATAALENAETSSIGRCLRIAGIGEGPSREEMVKANKPKIDNWVAQADSISDVTELRKLYAKAKAANQDAAVLKAIQDRAEALDTGSKDSGAGGSSNRGKADRKQ